MVMEGRGPKKVTPDPTEIHPGNTLGREDPIEHQERHRGETLGIGVTEDTLVKIVRTETHNRGTTQGIMREDGMTLKKEEGTHQEREGMETGARAPREGVRELPAPRVVA